MGRELLKSEADKAAKIFKNDTQIVNYSFQKVFVFLKIQDHDTVDKLESALAKYIPGMALRFAKYSRQSKQEALQLYDNYVQQVRQEVYEQAKAYINNQKQTNESTETNTTTSN